MTEFDDQVRGAIQIISQYLSESEVEVSHNGFNNSIDENDLYSFFEEKPDKAIDLVGELEAYFNLSDLPSNTSIKKKQGPFPAHSEPEWTVEEADATKIKPITGCEEDCNHAIDLERNSVDLIVTSPPYWKKRDYKSKKQLGQEATPDEYVSNLIDALERWKLFLRPTGSVFLNLGDTYNKKGLVGIPGQFAEEAVQSGWTIRNKIIWAKDNGIPSSAQDRLVPRHEPIFHLVLDKNNYYYDLHAYSDLYGNGSNPGDFWRISHDQNSGGHLAPFPEDLVERAITLACPAAICTACGAPRRRQRERGLTDLDTNRRQAERALEIFEESDILTLDHIRAIQATGISDAGKAQEFQEGAGANDEEVKELATEAKEVLGGYFREFTFPQWKTAGWTNCDCSDSNLDRGRVFDPFVGSGTTIKVANSLGCHGFGVDLDTSEFRENQTLTNFNQ